MAKRKKLTKKQRERRNRWLLGLFVAAIVFFGGYITGRRDVDFSQVLGKLDEATANIEQRMHQADAPRTPTPTAGEGTGQVHIFDVGQGAATLLIGSDGTSILIDTGRHDDGEKRIISYLDEHIGLGEPIDLLIFTHNDSDHIGHGDLVLEYFDVQEVWMNGMDHTTQVYDKLLDAVLASNADYAEPKAGERVQLGVFDIQVLHPPQDSPQKDQNDESIATRFTFDGTSLITTGDNSIAQEQEIIERGGQLQSDLMIVGHHGSNTSTGEPWLEAVQPQIAFYQAGIDNRYGHPSPETVERMEQAGIPFYGTAELGTISIYIDEQGEVNVETER